MSKDNQFVRWLTHRDVPFPFMQSQPTVELPDMSYFEDREKKEIEEARDEEIYNS